MIRELRPALVIFLFFTIVTGLLYPGLVTIIGRVAFPDQATGSVLTRGGHDVGSRLLGQPFSDPAYFWGRPSATGPQPFNGGVSSGSNLAATNPALEEAVRERIEALRAAGSGDGPVPVDLVTASGSGLDPHISPAAAEFQIARVAWIRGIEEAGVRRLIEQATVGRTFGILGEPRVNVLELNLALDGLE